MNQPNADISVAFDFSYSTLEEKQLDSYIIALESQLNGTRRPHGGCFGALDLVSFLEICLTFSVSTALAQLFEKYAEELLDAEAIKRLGENHRDQLKLLFQYVEQQIASVVDAVGRAATVRPQIKFKDYEQCVAMQFGLAGNATCYLVLNHSRVTKTLLAKLPGAAVSAFRYSIEIGLPIDAKVAQLYYDLSSETWKYLFIPTTQGFGKYIDRYIDLSTREVHTIDCPSHFLQTFDPSESEHYQLIISPWRD